jgi:alkylhydroperoxidase family enzyme
MAWIKTVSDAQASGPLKTMFDALIKRAGRVFNIVRVMSPNPPLLRASMTLYREAMHGDSPLSRAQRELLATVVSGVNNCRY